MKKILAWPIVVAFFSVLVWIAYSQVESDKTNHQAYLFGLASWLAMSATFIVMAILERFNRNIFNGKFLAYRFWISCCSAVMILIWLVLQIFPIPVWKFNSDILISFYACMFFGGMLIGWLITRSPGSRSPRNN